MVFREGVVVPRLGTLPRPRGGAEKEEDLHEPDNLGVKARAFSRFVKAAEHVIGTPLLAASQSSRVRSLASYGLPPISGFLERSCFVGKKQTAHLLEHVLASVDRAQAHRAQKTVAAGAERKKPVGAWGNAIWIKWVDYGVIRGTTADLPHDGKMTCSDAVLTIYKANTQCSSAT